MQFLTQEQCELLDLLRCDHGLRRGKSSGEVGDLISKLVTPEPQIDEPLTHRSVLGIH
ncbi:MAG: hypothetical protein M0R03_04735 [Novosphingobium sp.]|nr:hypothetical protein [Novosphingobium sp.]